jgi:hypothetical protein
MTKGTKGRGDAAPPAGGGIDESEEQKRIVAKEIESHLEILEAAGTLEEWNDVAAEILAFWLSAYRRTKFSAYPPERIIGGSLPVLMGECAKLSERVREGFRAGKRGRPRMILTARSDANLILRSIGNKRGASGILHFIEAVRLLAGVERIPEDQARKRVERAEKELGFKLPRSLRQFPKRRK